MDNDEEMVSKRSKRGALHMTIKLGFSCLILAFQPCYQGEWFFVAIG